jgi:hypothetical protein
MSQLNRSASPSIYWRRRLVVLGGLLVIVAVIVLIVVRPGFGEGGSTPAPEPVEIAEVQETPSCLPAQLELVARTDKLRYDSGEPPQLWLTVKNISSTECMVSVGTDVQRYVITSGADQIWASDDCQQTQTPFEMKLAPGEEQGTGAIPWDRTRSTPETCDSPSRPLMPGGGASYHLRVYIGELASAETRQFLLN